MHSQQHAASKHRLSSGKRLHILTKYCLEYCMYRFFFPSFLYLKHNCKLLTGFSSALEILLYQAQNCSMGLAMVVLHTKKRQHWLK
jgi:hypothetical protein